MFFKGKVAFGLFLQNSDLPVYKQMYEYMISHPEVLTETSDEGIERVRTYGVDNNYNVHPTVTVFRERTVARVCSHCLRILICSDLF